MKPFVWFLKKKGLYFCSPFFYVRKQEYNRRIEEEAF